MNELKLRAKAIKLRNKGQLFGEIAKELGVSKTIARNYALGLQSVRPDAESRENAPFVCGQASPKHDGLCDRERDHPGMHLANDRRGRLIWWRN